MRSKEHARIESQSLKVFKISPECLCGHHLEVRWQSQNTPDSVYEIGQKKEKAKQNKQEDILAKSQFAWLLRQEPPSKLSILLYPLQRHSMKGMYTASAV